MPFRFAFRVPPLSGKEKRRRQEVAKGFLGQWIMSSDLPFTGSLFMQRDEKNFRGSIEFSAGVHSREIKELRHIDISGERIGFGLIWKGNAENLISEKWLCFGKLSEDANQIDGKIYLYKFENSKPIKYNEVNWFATKTH